MKPIPLTRLAFLLPFNEVLTDIGAPATSLLAKFRLPTSLEEKADQYVPIFPAIRFTFAAQISQGVTDLGRRAAERLKFGHLSEQMRKSVSCSPTLLSALQQVCIFASFEDTNLRVWLEPGEHDLRICSILAGTEGMLHLENSQWLQNLMIIYIVRQFTGPDWAPATIAFEARYTPSVETQSLWPNTRFLSGQRSAWIDVSALQLSQPNLTKDASFDQSGNTPVGPDAVTTLRLMLSSYLVERLPSIAEVAEIAGTSTRSLQRDLKSVGLTYATLIDQVRYQKATELLRKTDAKIIDVAFATGYADPAHFTRAFRRMSGVTPRKYREDTHRSPSTR
jgi:AraC-like DNA-binding protein